MAWERMKGKGMQGLGKDRRRGAMGMDGDVGDAGEVDETGRQGDR